jgi:hypothetical protein
MIGALIWTQAKYRRRAQSALHAARLPDDPFCTKLGVRLVLSFIVIMGPPKLVRETGGGRHHEKLVRCGP